MLILTYAQALPSVGIRWLAGSNYHDVCVCSLPPIRPAFGPPHPPVRWVPGLCPGGQGAGPWRCPPIPSIAEIKLQQSYSSVPLSASNGMYAVTFSFTFTVFLFLVRRSLNVGVGSWGKLLLARGAHTNIVNKSI
jgi:hypothetical protein